MNDLKKQFIEFTLDHQILRFGNFSLNSGRQSPYFFNTGLCNTGKLLAKLAKFYSDLLVQNSIKYDFIFEIQLFIINYPIKKSLIYSVKIRDFIL